MQLSTAKHLKTNGFSFAEVCVAIVVCVLFGAAAFTTNQRLLIALRAQKETTAASMMLQERMEKFRSFSYSNAADKTYVLTNVVQNSTTSEAPLGNLSETITVTGYTAASGYTPASGDYNQWVRNAAHPTGQEQHHNDNLAANYDLIQVDVSITWTSAGGRGRTRDLSAIFGKGNIGP